MRQIRITTQITERTFITEKYFNEVSSLPLIDHEKEVELARRIKEGDKKAENELIKANLRFVISCAKKYQNRGLSLDDLIAEGNMGLIRAATRFDETRGFKFISYAVNWIRQAILEALSKNARLVRIPGNRYGQQSKIKDLISRMQQENSGSYSAQEICKELNIDIETYNVIVNGNSSISLDKTISQDSDMKLIDTMENTSDTIDQHMNSIMNKKQIEIAVSCLNELEKTIIFKAFGINEQNREYSNSEIAMELDCSSEKVRQMKQKSLTKMKRHLSTHFKIDEYAFQ